MPAARLLTVDDDPDTLALVSAMLEREGYEVETTTSPEEALEWVATRDYDAVLTDLGMTPIGGIELCERFLGTRPYLPIVVVTGQASLDVAVAALRAGAYDFVTKPVDSKLLAASVSRAVQNHRLHDEIKRLQRVVDEGVESTFVLGKSSSMRRVHELVDRVSPSDASVLIWGETGTGKELVARSIHAQSRRKKGPFIALNCAAVPANLLESELFGHARGAFTDAKIQRTGLFVQASGGTFFLDEIGEMPLEMQAKLLRALQERKVRPVGANIEIPFDARIVAATNRDLEEEIYHKRFREDLYYRINVVKIDLPPLRERARDILDLASHFLGEFSKRNGREPLTLSQPAAEKLMKYDWPGNVRELENSIERAVAMARFDQVTVEDLPERIRAYTTNGVVVSAEDPAEIVSLEILEKRYLLRVLQLVGGNKSRAAQLLGLDRRTLYRKLDRYRELSENATLPSQE